MIEWQRISTSLMIRLLDQRQPEIAAQIQGVMMAAYRIEAELLGAEDFPPLRRGISEIQNAESIFFGYRLGDRLSAVTEIEQETEAVNIASLVVHPDFFRRGIATRLIQHVLSCYPAHRIQVSTGALNAPALSLYERHGFREHARWSTECGIAMVTLSRNG